MSQLQALGKQILILPSEQRTETGLLITQKRYSIGKGVVEGLVKSVGSSIRECDAILAREHGFEPDIQPGDRVLYWTDIGCIPVDSGEEDSHGCRIYFHCVEFAYVVVRLSRAAVDEEGVDEGVDEGAVELWPGSQAAGQMVPA